MNDTPGPDRTPRIEPIGDSALLVTIGDRVDAPLAAEAQRLAAKIEEGRIAAGIGRPVPAHGSVLVPFDPLVISIEDATGVVSWALAATTTERSGTADPRTAPSRPIEIAVRYGGDDGPDLDLVADFHGLRPGDVIELHAGAVFDVRFLGFAPGFAYLGGLPEVLATPRRDSPRERVPAGSVGIAGRLSAIYPLAMPGGWQLIGRSEAILFDPDRPEPAVLMPGARVRFVPASRG